MSYFDDVVKSVDDARFNKYNCIPLGFERFEDDLPGIIKENYTLVTASSGIGKSKFALAKYIITPFEFVTTQETDIDVKIFAFLLEESKQKFYLSILSYLLFKKYDVDLSVKQLKSINKHKVVTDDIIGKMKSFDKWFEKFEAKVEIIDNIRNPFGIYKTVRTYCQAVGKEETEKRIVEGVERDVKTYKPNNPNQYVIKVTDNINLLHPEKNKETGESMNLHQAMSKFSNDYCLTMRDYYKCSIVNIQQQEAAKEKQEYYKGQSIESKLEPSLDGLGDNKLIQRDANEVLGLFAPDRYEIRQHRGYNIMKMQDNYRSLIILKSRDGEANARIGLYFNGKVNEFIELPPKEDFEKDPSLYDKILKKK